MRISFNIGGVPEFTSACEATIRNVYRGTKTATEQACQEILDESLKQVPRDTGTLASTGFYEVARRGDVKGYSYEGTIGYAGLTGSGSSRDRLNDKTGKMASSYAVQVHEDTTMPHPRGGKAKFLEDPVRDYGASKFKRVAEQHWIYAISEAGELVKVSK